MATITLNKELHSLELEQLLLSRIVYSEDRHELIPHIYPSLFTAIEFKNVFTVIKELDSSADIANVVIKTEQRFGYAPDATLRMLSHDLIHNRWRGVNAFSIIKLLKEMLFRRMIVERGKKLIEIAEDSDSNLLNGVNREIDKIITLDRKLMAKQSMSSESLATKTSNKINTDNDTIKTVDFLDKRLYGLTKRGVSSILARPKHLKSTMVDYIVSSAVENHFAKGLIISLEDPTEERVKRIIASRLDVSLSDMRFKRVKVPNSDILKVLKHNLHDKLFIVDKREVLTPEDAVKVINDIKPDIVAIDHIQKFHMDEMVIGLIRAITLLETAAIRNNCHIILTSQVTDKKMTERKNEGPEASDAQWTSALEQSSTEMISLHYPHVIDHNPYNNHILHMKILLSRYADAVGKVKLRINPDKGAILGEFDE